MKRNVFLAVVLLFTINSLKAQTTFKVGGFAKFDFINTQYQNGDPGGSAIGDFHIPSLIPVGGDQEFYENKFHIKESRFNFDISGEHNGKKLRGFMEFDFMLSPGGDERVSNSWNPRIRHFYFEYDKWLFGQAWSTFMIVVLPDDLDFTGAGEGIVFQRQPQIRYTLPAANGNWQFSLENPFFTITPDNTGGRITSTVGFPDAVIRKNFKGDWGTYSVAAIGRGINSTDSTDSRIWTPGFGITTGGKLKVGNRDDVRFTLTAGQGLGRYIAINFINGAEYDPAENKINTISSFNAYLAYLHHWTDKLRSSFNASVFFGGEDNTIDAATSNKSAQSYSANLLYAPGKSLMFGVEFMHAIRELQNGTKGSMNRLQFSARYSFNYKHTTNPN